MIKGVRKVDSKANAPRVIYQTTSNTNIPIQTDQ